MSPGEVEDQVSWAGPQEEVGPPLADLGRGPGGHSACSPRCEQPTVQSHGEQGGGGEFQEEGWRESAMEDLRVSGRHPAAHTSLPTSLLSFGLTHSPWYRCRPRNFVQNSDASTRTSPQGGCGPENPHPVLLPGGCRHWQQQHDECQSGRSRSGRRGRAWRWRW